ncbi:RES family NAD+ phosphorylase [Dinghuibacter silviterrae]|uniref:RES domain-containing protein n=1 Tax=Dinghuibacter silviterrae TaxID=1539049 RepID=A0A4R8DRW0_9BACT|nr:RES family NAD+ phosphorylase [Dinghuibacter silviterrae]TDX00548.1 RES domain-containing protein [Dinghuibacter silviterrae]
MIVYRITLARYADTLSASGNPARWNSKDVKVIYTAASRALACLENVVHRSARGLDGSFRTVLIELPSSVVIESIALSSLAPDWRGYVRMPYTQRIGDAWVASGASAVLRVPSAIVPEEYNFILNPTHPDFERIKHLRVEAFEFDARLKK